jgi:glyoxylase-like metal-dependent hydrolase (beta-lactamase superfamily II)
MIALFVIVITVFVAMIMMIARRMDKGLIEFIRHHDRVLNYDLRLNWRANSLVEIEPTQPAIHGRVPEMIMRRLLFMLAFLAPLCLQASTLIPIDVAPLEGAEIDQKFGTDPANAFMPKEAINSPRPPVYVVRAEDSDSIPLPYYKIARDTYFFFGNIAEVDRVNRGFNGNAGFVVTDEGVLVVDALGTPALARRMIASIREVTCTPIRYLIVTHAHPDHFYGASAFAAIPGLKVISHQGTEDYVYSSTIQRSVAYRKVFLPREMNDFHAVVPDILIGGGNPSHISLKFGGKSFEIYDVGQHHSHGDLLMWQKEDRILWISDLAFNGRITYLGDGHLPEIDAMQDWMLRQFPDVVLMVPGHGAPQTAPFDMVAKTRRYVDSLREKMRNALKQGQSLQDAVGNSDLAEFRDWPLYELNHRINANFVYRQLEEELF